jgi:uncharacterized protein
LQFTRENSAANVIRSYERGRIRIGERWVAGHVIVSAHEIVGNWEVTEPGALTLDLLAPAISLEPEIIVLGTGNVGLLPDLSLTAALGERAIGLEVMATPAACRTYNVLVHEGRQVVAALFNAGAPSAAAAR